MTELEYLADVASRIDGARWVMIGLNRGGVPHGHPDGWVWERTRATLNYALQGFIVRPHRERTP